VEALDIHSAMDGPTALLRVEGELDAATAPVLDEALRRAAAEGAGERVILDFANLTFVDSAGLSVLVAAHKRLQGEGTELVISAPSAAVRRLFAIAGIDRFLTITE
jgi:stage II sporulation protein AA (anti-sigma F factor antagonist)